MLFIIILIRRVHQFEIPCGVAGVTQSDLGVNPVSVSGGPVRSPRVSPGKGYPGTDRSAPPKSPESGYYPCNYIYS
jgi:hypothetical protein